MRSSAPWFLAAAVATAVPPRAEARSPERPINCGSCDEWNQPQEPFPLAPHAWYVGMRGLSAVVIDSGDGLVLLDGDLPQSARPILDHVRQLGLDPARIRYLGNSHAHFDHAGGIEALRRQTGATVLASQRGVEALALGGVPKDDPQHAWGGSFPRVREARAVADGEVVRLGSLALTAHATPGHTPGGVTWTWDACDADRCLHLVYADSLNAVAPEEYRFTDHPEVVAALRGSIAKIAALPCDVLVPVHPEATDLLDKGAGGPAALVDPGACAAYAEGAGQRLDARLAEEGR